MKRGRAAALEAALRFVEQREATMLETLRRWCDQNSGSEHPDSLAAMASMLAEDFQNLGVPLQRLPLSPYAVVEDSGETIYQSTGDLLLWHHQPANPHRALLMIHYDTVYPPGAAPAECRWGSDGILIGPGTADAKGGLLVMREALLALRRFELDTDIGWTAVANPDEELGSPASSSWIAENARQFDFGLVFEPTLPDGAMVAARKGSGNFVVVVRGRSAHAGRDPGAGRNAVVHLCRLLDRVDRLNANTHGTTVNIARFHGGGALNRVPDLAVGRFNVRAVDAEAQREITDQIHALVEEFDAAEGLRVTMHGQFQSPPKPVDAAIRRLQRDIEEAGAMAGRTIRWRDTGGACDGSKLAAAGLPNIDTLGPTGDMLHSPEEWVDTRTLVPAVQTVVAAMTRYADRITSSSM